MKRNVIIAFLVVLILSIIGVMVKDLFNSNISHQNPYELVTDSTKVCNEKLIGYTEIYQIKPSLDVLHGIAIDKNDNIIIVGSDLIVYDSTYTQIKRFKLPDTSSCVTTNANNDIIIASKSFIEIWTANGQRLKRWHTGNEAAVVTGIAATDKSIFVADADARLVYQFDYTGKRMHDIANEDKEKGVPPIIIRSPYFDVSIGRDNEIWVANPGRYMLEAFDNKGSLISSWGKRSNAIEGFGGCCNPTNFTLLANGNFVTSEKAVPRVKIYSPEGKFLSIVAGPDKFDEGTKGLDLAVDSKNKIYVLDPVRKQIRIFEKIKK